MREDTWQGCTRDGKPPVVGKEYRVINERKGTFFGRVLSADEGTWVTLEITSGAADALMSYNIRLEGETVTVRSSHTRMDEVAQSQESP